jgi:hypothetical protein
MAPPGLVPVPGQLVVGVLLGVVDAPPQEELAALICF